MGPIRNLIAGAAMAFSPGLQSGACAAEPPKVVVTLKPVHALAAGVMEGVAEPELLMPGGGSPHSYALKPSQARTLAAAGLVIRVSRNLETFLNRPIETLAADGAVLSLDETPGLILYGVREAGVWERHEHGGEAHGEPGGHDGERHAATPAGHGEHGHKAGTDESEDLGRDHAHGHDEQDTHIWLDPRNARAIVMYMTAELSRIWPRHAEAFAANAQRLSQRIATLDEELKASTAALRGKRYVVFHDAYRYFEERYGLRPAGSITVGPDRAPGAKRLLAIRGRIEASDAICVFAEPQFEPRLVSTLTQGTGARRGTLDPLGAALPQGPELYFSLMRNLAADLAACLSPK